MGESKGIGEVGNGLTRKTVSLTLFSLLDKDYNIFKVTKIKPLDTVRPRT